MTDRLFQKYTLQNSYFETLPESTKKVFRESKKIFALFSKLSQVRNFIKKETLAQVFFYEICEISRNTLFYRTPLVAACEYLRLVFLFRAYSFCMRCYQHRWQLEIMLTESQLDLKMAGVPKRLWKNKHFFTRQMALTYSATMTLNLLLNGTRYQVLFFYTIDLHKDNTNTKSLVN